MAQTHVLARIIYVREDDAKYFHYPIATVPACDTNTAWLIHWRKVKVALIMQTTFVDVFSLTKIIEFYSKFVPYSPIYKSQNWFI